MSLTCDMYDNKCVSLTFIASGSGADDQIIIQ